MIERSLAIKSPSIQYHLAGTKKVQQALALPGILEKWVVYIVLWFYSLESQNTKKTKTEMLSFYKQHSYFSQIVSKKAK